MEKHVETILKTPKIEKIQVKPSDGETRRSGRIVIRKGADKAEKAENTQTLRRFQSKYPRRVASPGKRRKTAEIPTNYDELKKKTEAGIIPKTVFYRPTSNSMYIPSITAEMLEDDGKHVTVNCDSHDYFKYVRVRQTTKIDYATPEKVLEIIDAVRRRPIIWDQRLVCHQNSTLIRRAWLQLDDELGVDEDYPLARRKQIWKNKKDYFSMAADSKHIEKWCFASAMEFYRPMVKFRSTVCLRPTVPRCATSSSSETSESVKNESPTPNSSKNLSDKLVLGNKRVKCTPDDKKNVLIFLLKSLHETGMANYEMMEAHGAKIRQIFEKNQSIMCKN